MTITNRFDGMVSRQELIGHKYELSASISMHQKREYVTTEEEETEVLHHLSKDDLKALIKEAEHLITIIERNED